MKRTLSSTFVPLDLRKILACVAADLVGYYFENNNLNNVDSFAVYIYSDPTLEDGECRFIEHEDEHRVFLCSNQYEMLSRISEDVLKTRTDEQDAINFPYGYNRARCKFNHDTIEREKDYIHWSIVLKSWDFDRACYFGLGHCFETDKIPKEDLKYQKGEEFQCRGERCKECRRVYRCELHPSKDRSPDQGCPGEHNPYRRIL